MFPPRSGRAAAMPRLLDLDGRGELTAAHVRLVAQALGKSERTVWRWLAAAREDQRFARVEAPHFTVTAEVRQLLALWGGNASRVHAELLERAAKDPDTPAVPSLSTLHRAIRRDLSRGERAGLKSGEPPAVRTTCSGSVRRRTATPCGRATTSTCRSRSTWRESWPPRG